MKHNMNLQDKYYNFILNGTKRIELRLNDEKRQAIKIGDEVVFENSKGENFSTKVSGLYRAESFEKLFRDFEIEILADKSMTKAELLAVLGEFYTVEKQNEFGVLGIRVEL